MTKVFNSSIKILDEHEDTACGGLKRFVRKDILLFTNACNHRFQGI